MSPGHIRRWPREAKGSDLRAWEATVKRNLQKLNGVNHSPFHSQDSELKLSCRRDKNTGLQGLLGFSQGGAPSMFLH